MYKTFFITISGLVSTKHSSQAKPRVIEREGLVSLEMKYRQVCIYIPAPFAKKNKEILFLGIFVKAL